MNVGFQIELAPEIERVRTDLERSIENVTSKVVRVIAEDAPEEMQSLMTAGGVSVKGESPRIRSGDLFRSLKGTVTSPTEIEIEMIGYSQFLDPVFGGNLDRPFVEKGIDRALAKSLSAFQ